VSARQTEDVLRLTRRANQGHTDIIADIIEPASENPQRAFRLPPTIGRDSFNFSKLFRRIFGNLFTSEKRLTRRANHRHYGIIAKHLKLARSDPPRAFLLERSNRTAAARHDATSPTPVA
jgi:hypothetical protein